MGRLLLFVFGMLTGLLAACAAQPAGPGVADPATRASGLIASGRLEEALADCDRAVLLNPSAAQPLVLRGWALILLARPEEAVRSLNRAAALAPRDPWVFVNRAWALNDLNRFGEAAADSDYALLLSPRQPMALINRGHARHETGDFRGAREDCEAAVAADPTSALAANSLAYLLATCPEASLRDGERAVMLAQKALSLYGEGPYRAMFLDTLAMALLEDFRAEEADTVQTEAVRLVETVGTPRERRRLDSYREHLGLIRMHTPKPCGRPPVECGRRPPGALR